jgi:hypothetical protein
MAVAHNQGDLMNPTNTSTSISNHLLHEVAHTILSLDTVYLLYGATVVVAAALWLAGVVAFGNCRMTTQPKSAGVAGANERPTPVAL